MKLTDAGGTIERKLMDEGVHIARCYLLADLGTHETEWQGTKKDKRQMVIGWEVPSQRDTFEIDGESKEMPLVICQVFTASLHENSKLRPFLETWRGKKFTAEERQGWDPKGLLGAACQLQVIHAEGKNGKTYANVAAVMPLPKGMEAPEQETANQYFTLDNGFEFDNNIPKWIVEKVHACKEWTEARDKANPAGVEAPPEDNSDDLPF